MSRAVTSAASVAVLVASLSAVAGDWPHYRGPDHDGKSPEKLPARSWPAGGLPVLWKAKTETGFSSFSIGGDRVFTVVGRNLENTKREVCVAFDAASGRELWAAPFGVAKYQGGGDSGGGGDGPRTTPVFNDGKVYVYNSTLQLFCLEAETGKTLWRKDVLREHAGRNISWNSAMSPIVDDYLVFVAGGGAGQSMLAFHKKTGALVWKSGNETITHSTAVPATIHGVRQVIFFMKSGLVSAEARTGRILWKYPFEFKTSTAISPVVCGDMVYCSAGYGVGAGLVKITKTGTAFSAAEVWRQRNELVNHWSTPVFHDGYLYGMFSFKEFGSGPLKCVELATGKIMWSQSGFGPGNVILVDDHLLALNDRGWLVLAKATPQAYHELARMEAVGGKCWTTPAYADGRIYVRSTTEGVCLDAAGKIARK